MKLIPSIPGLKHVTSVCVGCQRTFNLRPQSAPHVGIRMQEAWYCGAACFTAAAEKAITQLLSTGSEPGHRAERMPLGLFLVSRGELTAEQLREATAEQKESGEEIGDLLVRRGVVSEKQVAAARATQWGCPLFLLPSHGVRGSIRLPSILVQTYMAVPLHYRASTQLLLVGFVHTVDYGLLYAIDHILGCKTEAMFVTPSDFQIQLKLHDAAPAADPLLLEGLHQPAEMAAAVCKAAIDLEAHEASIAKCKGYLWARLKRESESIDLLIKTP